MEYVTDTPKFDTVIFDLGNVLITWDRRNLFGKLIDDPDELQDFLDNVFTMDDNVRLDAGTPLRQVAEDAAARNPDQRELIMTFAERWEETLGDVIDGSVDILRELSERGVRLFALSNWGKDTFAMIEENYPFFEYFDAMVISGREGVVKPDREIFDLLCGRHDVRPSRAIFIDDSPTNIAASMALGFESLLFDNPGLLREQLRERKLL